MRSRSGLEERRAHLERMLANPDPAFGPWRASWRRQLEGITMTSRRKPPNLLGGGIRDTYTPPGDAADTPSEFPTEGNEYAPGGAGVDRPMAVRTVGKTAFSGEPTPGRKLRLQATDFNRWWLTRLITAKRSHP